MKQFYSHGKLLLTAEYLILDGAKGLALPTKFGQDLQVENIDAAQIIWESFDHKNALWFTCNFSLPNLEFDPANTDLKIARTLQTILKETLKLNPNFLINGGGFHVKTNLTFPNNYGLGSSSTLINNIANWAHINAFDLLNNSFGGSGYDIACAANKTPILFQLKDHKPLVEPVNYNPDFKDHLFFVHLNKKQNSKDGIEKYRQLNHEVFAFAEEISDLTNELLHTQHLADFEHIIKQHEQIIASIIKQRPVQEALFSDYFGQTKSLGAWGGDFILATGNEDSPAYFKNKGFTTVLPYREMIL